MAPARPESARLPLAAGAAAPWVAQPRPVRSVAHRAVRLTVGPEARREADLRDVRTAEERSPAAAEFQRWAEDPRQEESRRQGESCRAVVAPPWALHSERVGTEVPPRARVRRAAGAPQADASALQHRASARNAEARRAGAVEARRELTTAAQNGAALPAAEQGAAPKAEGVAARREAVPGPQVVAERGAEPVAAVVQHGAVPRPGAARVVQGRAAAALLPGAAEAQGAAAGPQRAAAVGAERDGAERRQAAEPRAAGPPSAAPSVSVCHPGRLRQPEPAPRPAGLFARRRRCS